MKKIYFSTTSAIIIAIGILFQPAVTKAENLGSELSGRILLAMESNGEAWYVNPDDENRYYLGRPADAFRIMQELSIGVSNKTFDSFHNTAPERLSGKILLKTEDFGKAYYVNPNDLKIISLGSPNEAFKVMSEKGLGITNANLNTIPVKKGYDAIINIAKMENIVSVEWLKQHINDENLVIIDVRSGETAIKFSDEHIPNSVSASSIYFQVDLPNETNIPYNVPSKEEFEKLVRDYGVNKDSKIVIVYPGLIPKDVMCGTRTFWTFDYFGVDNVAILDGGFGKWKKEGGEITNKVIKRVAGNFSVEKQRSEDIATLENVKSAISDKNSVLLDARMNSDYIGKTKQDFIPEFGHIAGSINYFAPLFLNPDLTFKSAKQINFEMSLLGIKKDKNVIAYCNSGQFATTAWFALKMIAEYPNVASYDGSVSEWVNSGKLLLKSDY